MDSIETLRREIDSLDDEIMEKLDKRYECSMKIGELKQKQERSILDTNREEQILRKTSNFSHSPQIKEVYQTIMSESKKLQRK